MLTVLHGFTETDAVWRQVCDGRIAAHCELLPGHGHKPCPAGITFASLAADLASRLPPAGGDVLGYSMGGRIAMRLALDHPQRVRRLVLISVTAGIIDPREREQRRKRDDRLADILAEDGIGPFVSWWEANPALRPAKPVARKVSEDIRSQRLNQDPVTLADNLRQLGAGMMEPLWDRLPELTMPVLLVAGAADAPYVRKCQDMAARIPSSRIEIIPDAGHAVHREQPAALMRAVAEFIA